MEPNETVRPSPPVDNQVGNDVLPAVRMLHIMGLIRGATTLEEQKGLEQQLKTEFPPTRPGRQDIRGDLRGEPMYLSKEYVEVKIREQKEENGMMKRIKVLGRMQESAMEEQLRVMREELERLRREVRSQAESSNEPSNSMRQNANHSIRAQQHDTGIEAAQQAAIKETDRRAGQLAARVLEGRVAGVPHKEIVPLERRLTGPVEDRLSQFTQYLDSLPQGEEVSPEVSNVDILRLIDEAVDKNDTNMVVRLNNILRKRAGVSAPNQERQSDAESGLPLQELMAQNPGTNSIVPDYTPPGETSAPQGNPEKPASPSANTAQETNTERPYVDLDITQLEQLLKSDDLQVQQAAMAERNARMGRKERFIADNIVKPAIELASQVKGAAGKIVENAARPVVEIISREGLKLSAESKQTPHIIVRGTSYPASYEQLRRLLAAGKIAEKDRKAVEAYLDEIAPRVVPADDDMPAQEVDVVGGPRRSNPLLDVVKQSGDYRRRVAAESSTSFGQSEVVVIDASNLPPPVTNGGQPQDVLVQLGPTGLRPSGTPPVDLAARERNGAMVAETMAAEQNGNTPLAEQEEPINRSLEPQIHYEEPVRLDPELTNPALRASQTVIAPDNNIFQSEHQQEPIQVLPTQKESSSVGNPLDFFHRPEMNGKYVERDLTDDELEELKKQTEQVSVYGYLAADQSIAGESQNVPMGYQTINANLRAENPMTFSSSVDLQIALESRVENTPMDESPSYRRFKDYNFVFVEGPECITPDKNKLIDTLGVLKVGMYRDHTQVKNAARWKSDIPNTFSIVMDRQAAHQLQEMCEQNPAILYQFLQKVAPGLQGVYRQAQGLVIVRNDSEHPWKQGMQLLADNIARIEEVALPIRRNSFAEQTGNATVIGADNRLTPPTTQQATQVNPSTRTGEVTPVVSPPVAQPAKSAAEVPAYGNTVANPIVFVREVKEEPQSSQESATAPTTEPVVAKAQPGEGEKLGQTLDALASIQTTDEVTGLYKAAGVEYPYQLGEGLTYQELADLVQDHRRRLTEVIQQVRTARGMTQMDRDILPPEQVQMYDRTLDQLRHHGIQAGNIGLELLAQRLIAMNIELPENQEEWNARRIPELIQVLQKMRPIQKSERNKV